MFCVSSVCPSRSFVQLFKGIAPEVHINIINTIWKAIRLKLCTWYCYADHTKLTGAIADFLKRDGQSVHENRNSGA